MKISSSNANLSLAKKQSFGKISGKEPLEIKKQRLKKATKEFESYFVLHMLKAMRKTIPKSDLTSGGLGQDVYTSMFDEELSRSVAGSSPNSLSELLYRSLEDHLTEEFGATDTKKSNMDTDISKLPRLSEQMNYGKVSPDSKEDQNTIERVEMPVAVKKPHLQDNPVMRKYGESIAAASKKYNISSRLIYSVIMAESGGKADAVSEKGAKGLMQLTDSTATYMGVADSLDPEQNIMGGTKYLRRMLDKFDGDMRLALAAYNAGPGTVSKYNGIPPYRETAKYVEKVLGNLQFAKKAN